MTSIFIKILIKLLQGCDNMLKVFKKMFDNEYKELKRFNAIAEK